MNHHNTVVALLNEHFKDRANITGIEIGTGAADLTKNILSECPHLVKLYTVDPWKHVDGVEFEASWPQERLDGARDVAFKRLEQYKDRCIIMHMTSDEVYERLAVEDNIFVDFVWIDGHHSGEQIIKDLRFESIIKPGGFIGGHDYGQCHPLTEIIKEKYGDSLNSGEDFTWWVFK